MKKFTPWGLIFNFFGTIALGYGLLLNSTQINQLSGTYADYNPFMVNSLIANRNWALVGFLLIAIGFILQFIDAIKK